MDKTYNITEQTNQVSNEIDQMNTCEIIQCINNEDKMVAKEVGKHIEQIADAVDLITEALKNGGRLIYIGAGTSGRLGVLDASECLPTFNVSPEIIKGIIAGGDKALRVAIEGIEDNMEQAVADLKNENLNEHDVVVGITASGSTPYVISALDYARKIGAKTVGIACNPSSKLRPYSDVCIEIVVGPEVIAGSTRLKAGTAQKMVLNMLSTASMVKLGKTYKNIMVDLQITNNKLKRRAVKILKSLTKLNDDKAEIVLKQNNWNLKEAVVMYNCNVDNTTAKKYLDECNGIVTRAIEACKKTCS